MEATAIIFLATLGLATLLANSPRVRNFIGRFMEILVVLVVGVAILFSPFAPLILLAPMERRWRMRRRQRNQPVPAGPTSHAIDYMCSCERCSAAPAPEPLRFRPRTVAQIQRNPNIWLPTSAGIRATQARPS